MFKTKYARLPPPKVDVVAYNAKRRELYLQGIDYLYGKNGKDKNVETAYQLITQSADMNYPYAISAIGSFYAHGLIVDKDYGKALKIYTEMFNRLNPNAAYNIGILYQKGWGVDIDLDKAAWYFSASAAFAARELCQGEELGMRILKESFSEINVNEAVRKYQDSPICEFCHGLVPYENEKDYFRNRILSFSLREKLFHAIEKKNLAAANPY